MGFLPQLFCRVFPSALKRINGLRFALDRKRKMIDQVRIRNTRRNARDKELRET
jgi:hypothetical protein